MPLGLRRGSHRSRVYRIKNINIFDLSESESETLVGTVGLVPLVFFSPVFQGLEWSESGKVQRLVYFFERRFVPHITSNLVQVATRSEVLRTGTRQGITPLYQVGNRSTYTSTEQILHRWGQVHRHPVSTRQW